MELVKVKVALPAATPVTAPALVTLAEAGVLLTQVPPVVGDKVVVPPLAQIEDAPVILTVGRAVTVTAVVVLAQFGAVELVKVKVALPAATPVTTPALVTVALVVSLLAHIPPMVGDKVMVLPTHTDEEGVLTTGNGLIIMAPDTALVTVQPAVLVMTQ